MMKTVLKLILSILLGVEKTSDLALENLALREQVAILKRSIKQPRSSLLDLAFSILEKLEETIDRRQTRNCHSVASNGFQATVPDVADFLEKSYDGHGCHRFSHSSHRHLPDSVCTGFLSHNRRKVVHFNVVLNPTARWTAQQIVEAFS